MEISCGFPPSQDVVDHAVLAESLGYRRVWLYDSPALYGDVWVALARIADRTERIGLGPAVLIPNLRHVLVQASAMATLESLAPGRTVAAIGTGFTGRMALGQKALPWHEVESYVRALRALLRGEPVEIEGAMVGMIPAGGWLPEAPIEVPILIAANGPKGIAVAHELGDGVMTVGGGRSDFDWCAVLAMGTILDEDELPSSPRALAAAGAGLTVVYHAMYEGDPESVDALPGGAEWRARLERDVPQRVRHLAVHEEHLVIVNERDQALVSGDLLPAFTWTGSAKDVRARLDALEADGATEILYAPAGPDIPRELEAFAAMAGL